jgi:hypothetical protein
MTTASPSNGEVPLYGGVVHTHGYPSGAVTHSHESQHFPRGTRPRMDGSEPAVIDADDPQGLVRLAQSLNLLRDTQGYTYMQVGPDHYVCLGVQLIRACIDKWPPASRAAVEEVGGALVPLAPAKDGDRG